VLSSKWVQIRKRRSFNVNDVSRTCQEIFLTSDTCQTYGIPSQDSCFVFLTHFVTKLIFLIAIYLFATFQYRSRILQSWDQSIDQFKVRAVRWTNSLTFKWRHPRCVCINYDKGDPSNITQLEFYYILLYSLLRQHVSTLSRGHHQAVEVITKSMDVRLPDGIPFDTVCIRKYDKMEHTETNTLIILNRNELVNNAECREWSTCCTDGIEFVVYMAVEGSRVVISTVNNIIIIVVVYSLCERRLVAPVCTWVLTFRNPASYIKDGHTATFNTPHFLYFFNKYTYWIF
jgi:hypothetical protein